MTCPYCANDDSEEWFRSSLEWAVRSDWRPIKAAALVRQCRQCGELFKAENDVLRYCDYDDYSAWGDKVDRDQIGFSTGHPLPRSRALLDHLRSWGALTGSSRVLDFGCNRGALLALLGNERPAAHAGFDVSERHRARIESLGMPYFTPDSPPPEAAFDLVTLVHVAEHLMDVAVDLAPALRALAPGGRVCIQVPYTETQPTDLYVMDHRMHASPIGLDRALARAGLAPVRPTESILPGELTGLYARADIATIAPNPLSAKTAVAIRGRTMIAEQRLLWVKRSGAPVVVFGAGLIGAHVARVLGDQVTCFADDNEETRGELLLGLRVRAPADLPRSRIVLAVPPSAAPRVAARCRDAGHDVVSPFDV